ncbi:MAG TPA: Trm112 family protein [Rudaea sp.]|nr:Trm112 family protein [Rudaea sp.]
MDKRLLDILCCPTTKQPLRLMTRAELDALNRAIAGGGARTGAAAPVTAAVVAGLITGDGRRVYRIEDDIPVLLADEAIAAEQLEGFPAR